MIGLLSLEMNKKKISVRTCIGCKNTRPKNKLIRIVRTPEGKVRVDPSGKSSGRGAYFCPVADCFAAAVKRKQIDKSLKTSVTLADIDELRVDFLKLIEKPIENK